MMGWLCAITLAGLTLAFLRQTNKLSGEALEIVAVALIVAFAGYAWQGSPEMAGKPALSGVVSG
jgi:cytochrome c-type biogenesis protein CcmH